jgi:hypothetical protein
MKSNHPFYNDAERWCPDVPTAQLQAVECQECIDPATGLNAYHKGPCPQIICESCKELNRECEYHEHEMKTLCPECTSQTICPVCKLYKPMDWTTCDACDEAGWVCDECGEKLSSIGEIWCDECRVKRARRGCCDGEA